MSQPIRLGKGKLDLMDLSLDFYCAVDDGIVVTAMRPGDLFANTQDTLSAMESRILELEVTLACDCFLRRLEVEQTMKQDQAKAMISRFRLVGFNTYGEQLNGIHMNQTLTGVMIGKPPRDSAVPRNTDAAQAATDMSPYLAKKAG